MALSPAPGQPPVLTVSDLNRLARETLEQSFPLLWVAGEISNFTRAASGHWYFSLKDGSAQVRCAMFRGRNAALDWMPREGDHVFLNGTYFRVTAVVWQFGEPHDRDLTVPELPVDIHLQKALPPQINQG